MNAVIYARYSSHAQREESIEQQVAVCREYCERRGMKVLRVYSDAARSGRSTEGREAFAAMIADARAGEFGAVVVTLPIVTHEKALNHAGGFSAVHGWLPRAVLGSKPLAWRVTPSAVLLYARTA